MTKRHLTCAALALTGALALSACGDDAGTTAAPPASGGGHSAGSGGAHGGDAAKGKQADVAFLSGMKPHHEQAVEMSDIVLAANPPAAVAAIARQIKAAQAPEIEQMDTMLEDLGQSTGSGGHGGGHSGAHGGMMSDTDLAALKAATGVEAARLYLEAMIEHHEGAIEAAEAELKNGSFEPARALATSIAKAQAEEITTMTSLLAGL